MNVVIVIGFIWWWLGFGGALASWWLIEHTDQDNPRPLRWGTVYLCMCFGLGGPFLLFFMVLAGFLWISDKLANSNHWKQPVFPTRPFTRPKKISRRDNDFGDY